VPDVRPCLCQGYVFAQSLRHDRITPVESADLAIQIAVLPAFAETVLGDKIRHSTRRVRIRRTHHFLPGGAEFLDRRAEQLADEAGLGAETRTTSMPNVTTKMPDEWIERRQMPN
jgi:hypothetical protein